MAETKRIFRCNFNEKGPEGWLRHLHGARNTNLAEQVIPGCHLCLITSIEFLCYKHSLTLDQPTIDQDSCILNSHPLEKYLPHFQSTLLLRKTLQQVSHTLQLYAFVMETLKYNQRCI